MAILFWGGSTFWIFWWCNGQILLKMFLVRILGKRIFLTEFSADRPKFRPQTHKWNFKNWRFLEIFFKFSVFFFQIGSKHRHESQKSKKNFHQNWSTFHVKILVQRHYVNFFCRKKTQKFSSFFYLLKNARKCQKTKNSKKKIFFWFFCNSHFFMENRQIRPKTGQKCWQHMFTWY